VTDQLAGALATLITAMSTAVLMAAAYYWGPQKRSTRRNRRVARKSEGNGDQ